MLKKQSITDVRLQILSKNFILIQSELNVMAGFRVPSFIISNATKWSQKNVQYIQVITWEILENCPLFLNINIRNYAAFAKLHFNSWIETFYSAERVRNRTLNEFIVRSGQKDFLIRGMKSECTDLNECKISRTWPLDRFFSGCSFHGLANKMAPSLGHHSCLFRLLKCDCWHFGLFVFFF